MKPVQQTILTPPTGNCLAACVASLFEMPLWLVPNFAATGGLWWERLAAFAAEEGWRVLMLNHNVLPQRWWGRFMFGDHAIATIASDRCVIADILTGEVVWDPYPGGYAEGHQLDDSEIRDWLLIVALK